MLLKYKLFSLLLLLLFTSLFPTISSAHNGARDELGGHFRRADCVYLLHDPTPLAQSAKNIDELIVLIKQNNSNSQCVSNLSPSTIDLEGYSFPSESTTPAPATTQPNQTTTPKPAAPAIALGQKYSATLDQCVDGDTANFNINGTVYKTRFLYIDTPEYTTEKEPFGKEASEFTCSFLKQGTLTLETDGAELYDKYDRLLAWVWVGDKLQQEEITKAGYVEDFYDYGTYKHEQTIISAMDYAKGNYLGIYASNKPEPTTKQDNNTNVTEEKKEDTVAVEANTKAADKKESVQEDVKQVASGDLESTEEKNEVSDGYAIIGLILAVLLFLLPRIKYTFGVSPLIAHKLKARKWWINVILFFIYAAFWWIIQIILVIELIHLFKKRRRFA
jgi:endonuclease YncB( thermonuclease family)